MQVQPEVAVDIPPDLEKAIPSIGGSLVAQLFQRDRWARRILTFLAGVYLAHIFGDLAARIMNTGSNVGAAVVALFGVAIVAKVLDGIMNFDIVKAGRELWLAVLKRVRG